MKLKKLFVEKEINSYPLVRLNAFQNVFAWFKPFAENSILRSVLYDATALNAFAIMKNR